MMFGSTTDNPLNAQIANGTFNDGIAGFGATACKKNLGCGGI